MKTLNDILAMTKDIEHIVSQFGFSDKKIRLYFDNPEETEAVTLHFVVKEKKGENLSYENTSLLAAKLIEKLGCDITITNYDAIDELYRHDFDQKSALITDGQAQSKLLNVEKTKPIFKLFSKEDPYEIELQKELLRKADEYLEKKNTKNINSENKIHKTNKTDLFKNSNEKKSSPELTFNPKTFCVQLTIPLPESMDFEKLNKTEIAEQLAQKFFEIINNTPSPLVK